MDNTSSYSTWFPQSSVVCILGDGTRRFLMFGILEFEDFAILDFSRRHLGYFNEQEVPL